MFKYQLPLRPVVFLNLICQIGILRGAEPRVIVRTEMLPRFGHAAWHIVSTQHRGAVTRIVNGHMIECVFSWFQDRGTRSLIQLFAPLDFFWPWEKGALTFPSSGWRCLSLEVRLVRRRRPLGSRPLSPTCIMWVSTVVRSVKRALSLASYGKCGPPEASSWEGILLIHDCYCWNHVLTPIWKLLSELFKDLKR